MTFLVLFGKLRNTYIVCKLTSFFVYFVTRLSGKHKNQGGGVGL